MQAAVTERFRRVLSFHSRVGEAEAMAAAVPATAGRLAADDPDTFPGGAGVGGLVVRRARPRPPPPGAG